MGMLLTDCCHFIEKTFLILHLKIRVGNKLPTLLDCAVQTPPLAPSSLTKGEGWGGGFNDHIYQSID